METLKKHSKAIIICAVILVLIIVLFVVKVDPINFNDLYSDLDEEYWCTIADDGSWMKITLWHNSVYLDHVESINEDLGFSSAVYEEMMDTRAIDGRLTAKGENVKASWSYDGSELSILYEADGNAQSIFDKLGGFEESFSKYSKGIIGTVLTLVFVVGVGYLAYTCIHEKDDDIESYKDAITEATPVARSENDDTVSSFDISISSESVDGEEEVKKKVGVKIPVYGNVAAGIPIEAWEDILDYEEIDEDIAQYGEYFALKIKGDSMEPKISDGDVVIVACQSDVDSGQIAIVLVNGNEATCKKIKKTPEGVYLISTNPEYDPMFFNNKEIEELPIRILGRVIELRAKF